MDGMYSTKFVDDVSVRAWADKLRGVVREITAAPCTKGEALETIAPFYAIVRPKLFELLRRSVPKVRLTFVDEVLISRGTVALYRYAAEWHFRKAQEFAYRATCEERGIKPDLEKFWRERFGDKKCQHIEKQKSVIA